MMDTSTKLLVLAAVIGVAAALLFLLQLAEGPPSAESSSDAGPPDGRFTVDGDVSLRDMKVKWVSLVATSPQNPMAPKPDDPCHFALDLSTGGPKLRLAAVLSGGLPAVPVGSGYQYPVDRIELDRAFTPRWGEARPNTFFASLDLPSEERTPDGVRTIPGSGSFRSQGGSGVFVMHFDGSRLHLVFMLSMIENIDDRFRPRRVTVQGWVSMQLGQRSSADLFKQLLSAPAQGLDPLAVPAVYMCGNREAVLQIAKKAK